MKKSLELKLEHMIERFQEVSRLLSESEIISDQNQFRTLSKFGKLSKKNCITSSLFSGKF